MARSKLSMASPPPTASHLDIFRMHENKIRTCEYADPQDATAHACMGSSPLLEVFGGVFYTTSRFNHSCDANAVFKWNSALGKLTVHSCKPISAGEEITLNYGFGGSCFQCRELRQSHLRSSFGFDCTCAKCQLQGDALRESEARAASIGDFESFFADLEAWSAPQVLESTPAAVTLSKLEERGWLMAAECPDGVHYGTDFLLQAFVEFCDLCTARLHAILTAHADRTPPADAQALRADASAFREAARRWAGAARDAAHVVAGGDSPAFLVWTWALESARGCWPDPNAGPRDDGTHPAAAQPGELFARRWVDAGLSLTPISIAYADDVGGWRGSCVTDWA
mmetsp:Transcript_55392/g.109999  ORF Transcript_55392/g.109999 Transcript_55392/m.109999 type:complete len:340 (-) Transcript_55392:81-1100(-)